jgi:hypothetical protein
MPAPPVRPFQKGGDGVLHCQDRELSQPTDYGHDRWDLGLR